MSREWKLYFDDLLGFCEKVISYTHGLTREEFETSGLNYDATLWNVQLFGEAAKNIPEEIRSKIPEVPWRELIGMRNRLAHGYFGINNAMLWHVVEIEVPKLHAALLHIAATRTDLFKGQS
ncbi:DUF86 domain-containing protein [Sideroxydans sp. CL21]|uniref:HepT-like ribonuclease domain-containing protein n=1 Tax=Sideroxydans sp. CL21 TaxID=2600596 RepID=UPI0012A98975|nr:DUF86 domain-containing protein [Sideroxydans sp. CL21]VVC85496.1 FIG094328: hypothetical protein [Sideroxydans sp. CL21]